MKREASLFLAGSLGLNLARLVREFVVIALLVEPGAAAVWVLASLIRQFGAFSDLGASNALARLLPEAFAQSDSDRPRLLAGTALSLSLLTTLGLAVVGFGVAFALAPSQPWLLAAPWLALILVMDKVFLLQTTIQRSRGQWKSVMGQYLSLGALELGLASVLATWFGLQGALGGTALALIVVGLAGWRPVVPWLRLEWDAEARKRVTKLGGLLLGFGLANIAVHSVDRVALMAAGAKPDLLASYHLAAYASIAVAQVAGGVMGVYSARLFRASSDDTQKFARALGFPVYGMATIGLATGLVALPLLVVALPLAGKEAAVSMTVLLTLLAAEVVICWAMPMESALVGLDRGGWALPARVVGILVALGGGYVAYRAGHGAEGVAAARLAGQAVVGASVLGLAARATGVALWRPLLSLLAPALLVAGGLGLVAATVGLPSGLQPVPALLLAALAGVLAASVVWGPARSRVESLMRTVPG